METDRSTVRNIMQSINNEGKYDKQHYDTIKERRTYTYKQRQLNATRNVYEQLHPIYKTKSHYFSHIVQWRLLQIPFSFLITHTSEFPEAILLQLSASSIYHTSGENDIILLKVGSDEVLILVYTFHTDRHIFQNYTLNDNLINDGDSEFALNFKRIRFTISL